MTEKTPLPTRRSKNAKRHAPAWVAPSLAVVAAAALTWGAGTTLFHGALVERGLPEQVNESTADERLVWEHGAQLADFATQAEALAKLAPQEGAQSIAKLADSLTQASSLLGQLRYNDQEPVQLPQSYSPDAVLALSKDVLAASASLPSFKEPSITRDTALAQIAFQINLDARQAAAISDPKGSTELALPLSQVAEGTVEQPVACLPDEHLLDPSSDISDSKAIAPVTVARALDRGYALDFLLQLHAARGANAAEAPLEKQRTELGDQLRTIRSVVDSSCADLREPAYDLPEDGLEQLTTLVSEARSDYAQALVSAAGNTVGAPRQEIAEVAFGVLTTRQSAGLELQILETRANN